MLDRQAIKNKKQVTLDANGIPLWSSPEAEETFNFLSRQSDAIMDGSYNDRREEFKDIPIWNMPDKKEEPLGIAGSVWDATGKAVGYGLGRAAEETVQFGYDTLNFFDDVLGLDKLDNDYEVASDFVKSIKPKTAVGGFVSAATQFIVGFVGAGKVIGATRVGRALSSAGKVGKYGKVLLQGALADFATQDPHEARLSNLIESYPALSNPITEYLQADEDDGKLEGRLKNALEGTALGLATDAVFKGIKVVRMSRKMAKAGEKASAELVQATKKAANEADKAATEVAPKLQQQSVVEEGAVTASTRHQSDTGAITQITDKGQAHVLSVDGSTQMMRIEDLLAGLEDVTSARGIDIGRITGEISDVIENVLSRRLSPEELAEEVNKGINRLFPEGAKPSLDFGEFVNDFMKKSKENQIAREFVPTQSVVNTDWMANGNPNSAIEKTRLLYETLEETGSFTRGVTETETQSLSDVVKKAAKTVKDMFQSGQVDESLLKERLGKMANAGEGLAEAVVTTQAALEEYSERALKFMESLDSLKPGDATTLLANNGKRMLQGFMETAQYMDRLSTGIARGLQAHQWFGKFSIKDMPDLKKLIDKQGVTMSVQETLNNMTESELLFAMRRISTVKDAMKQARMLLPDSRTGKLMVMANEYWINAILSSPTTHMTNILSNTIKLGVMMPVEKMMSARWGYMRNGHFDKALWNDGAKAWVAMYNTMGDAWRMAKKALECGHNILKPTSALVDFQERTISAGVAGVSDLSSFGKLINNIGKVVNMPTRFLMSGDEFFSQLAYRSHIYTTLYTEAEEKFARNLLTGASKESVIAEYIKENFEKYFVDVTAKTGETIKGGSGALTSGLDEAMEATFTKSLADNTIGKSVHEMSLRHPMVRRIMPFVKTPLNIMNDAIAHTPFIANCTKAYRNAMAEGGRSAALAQGKVLLGSAVWLTAAMAAMNGCITGSGPKNKAQREALLETGWKPYSIKFGDTYVSFERIEPFGTLLGMAGNYAEIAAAYDEEEGDEALTTLAGQMVFSLFHNLSSKTYMRGLTDVMMALNDKDEADRVIREHIASHVPSFLLSVRRMHDPAIREAEGLIDEMKNRIPGLAETLPAKYSWLTGEPVILHGGRMSAISPVLTSEAKDNPVAEELAKFPRAVLGIQKDIGGVKLSTEQLSDYARLHGKVKLNGKTLMEALRDVIEDPAYDRERKITKDTRDQMDDPRYRMLQDVVMDYRMEARKALFKIYPELRDMLLQGREDSNSSIGKAVRSVSEWDVMPGRNAEERRKAFYDSIMSY